MTLHHYYHIYADGDWRLPLKEHIIALKRSHLLHDIENVTVGVVGNIADRGRVIANVPEFWRVEQAKEGYEQFTLDVMYADLCAGRIAPHDWVLYAHSKGAAYPTEVADDWRRCMTKHLITESSECRVHLLHGADTVGVHWLTPEEYPEQVQIPYYGGNFWWATGEHLLRLPAPSHETRYHAEAWLGTVPPAHPVDLQPGWPGGACSDHN